MFPVSDFNFMVAGIATFAATVGYSYARHKLNPTTESGPPDNVQSKDEQMSAPTEENQATEKNFMEAGPSSATPDTLARRESLKRKEPHDGFEEDSQNLGYPHNLANIYPRKRCRTPSSEKGKDKSATRQFTPLALEDSATEDWILVHNVNTPNATINEPPRTPSPGTETVAAATPATEGTDSPFLVTSPIPPIDDDPSQTAIPVVEPKEPDCPATPTAASTEDQSPVPKVQKVEAESRTTVPLAPKPNEPKSSAFGTTSTFTPVPSFQKISLQKPITSPFAARGFADFSGNKTPFSTFAASQATSQRPDRPVWLAGNNDTSDNSERLEIREDSGEEHALTQAKSTAKPITDQTIGEEDEDVEMELKNVKLYVKRGDKPFTEGIVGHCKLLKDRITLNERLLFRREPLRRISINACINTSLRCLFDPTENTLRIVTQEPRSHESTASADQNSLEIVVYAMKPGRSCSKHDFKVFSETLIKNPRLKPSSSA